MAAGAERVDQVRRNGLVFDVDDAGPADGDVVVLLHGFPQAASAWSRLASSLQDAGYRTLAPDQRGYSPGARPQDTAAYATRELVDDALAVADAACAERFHVVGHDWGGYVAWALAASEPDRLASVTVMSTPHPRAFAAAARHGQALKSWYMVMFQVPGLAERVVRPGTWMWSQLVRGLPKDAVDRYTARMNDPAAFRGALAWYRAAAAERRHPTVRIGDVAVPALMFWGDRDPALGRWAAEHTADHVTGPYRFEVLGGAGHWLPEKRADVMAPVLLEHFAANPATG